MSSSYLDDREDYHRIHKQFRIAGFFALVTLAVGVAFYHLVEGLSLVDAIYFCVITLTTVGYGDISPETDLGKLFTAGYVLVGIGIIGTFANLLLKRSIAKRQLKQAEHAPDRDSK